MAANDVDCRARVRRSLAAAGLLASLTACGSEVGSGDDTDAPEDTSWVAQEAARDPCGFADAPASQVELAIVSDVFHAGPHAKIHGTVRSLPPMVVHEVVAEEGPCRYLQAATGFCDPPCEGEQCSLDGECIPYPELLAGGSLGVFGLAEQVEITAWDTQGATYDGPDGLPAALFANGELLGIRFVGDELPATRVSTTAVDPIDTTLTETGFAMTSGQPAAIEWTPGPDPDACVQLLINGSNAIHGAPLADIIWCETTDTGSLDLPQAMVDTFPLGETPEVTEGYDWPHSELVRYARHTVDTAHGTVRLLAASRTQFMIRHDP